jgi:hypothetical protein
MVDDDSGPTDEEQAELDRETQAIEREYRRIGFTLEHPTHLLLPVASFDAAVAWLRAIPDGAGWTGVAARLAAHRQGPRSGAGEPEV